MKRTNIFLTDENIRYLKAEADRKGVSMSEVIRRLIDGSASKKPKRGSK